MRSFRPHAGKRKKYWRKTRTVCVRSWGVGDGRCRLQSSGGYRGGGQPEGPRLRSVKSNLASVVGPAGTPLCAACQTQNTEDSRTGGRVAGVGTVGRSMDSRAAVWVAQE